MNYHCAEKIFMASLLMLSGKSFTSQDDQQKYKELRSYVSQELKLVPDLKEQNAMYNSFCFYCEKLNEKRNDRVLLPAMIIGAGAVTAYISKDVPELSYLSGLASGGYALFVWNKLKKDDEDGLKKTRRLSQKDRQTNSSSFEHVVGQKAVLNDEGYCMVGQVDPLENC